MIHLINLSYFLDGNIDVNKLQQNLMAKEYFFTTNIVENI